MSEELILVRFNECILYKVFVNANFRVLSTEGKGVGWEGGSVVCLLMVVFLVSFHYC